VLSEKEQIEEARAALESAKTTYPQSQAALADKKVTNDQFQRARDELATLEKALEAGQKLEAKDASYASLAKELREQVAKDKPALAGRWLEVGLTLQKGAVEAAIKTANTAIAAAKQKNATEETVAKAEAAAKAVGPTIERGVPFEPQDAKYLAFVTPLKTQPATLEKAAADARQAFLVRIQRETLTKAKAASDASLVVLRKSIEEKAFETSKLALDDVEKSLAAGKSLEEKDAEYTKLATTVRTTVEAAKTEITGHRARQKTEVHKAAVESARKIATDANAALAKTLDPPSMEASEKAVRDLEVVLATGKDFVATDKKYADYAAVVTKEIEARKAAIAGAKAQVAIKGEKTTLESAVAELDAKAGAYKATPTPEALAAAEKAAAELEKTLQAQVELASKDKAHAALVATLTKKLADQRAMLVGTKNDATIVTHRAAVIAKQTAVADMLKALAGKIEYEPYANAAKVIEDLGKTLGEGDALGASNAKYAAEIKVARDKIPGYEMQVRKTWIEAADLQVKARIKALEGKPDAAAFSEAEKAQATLAKTVDSSKIARLTDKAYLAFVATSEKQAAAYKTQIDQRRGTLKIETSRAGIDAAATAATEAMKALDGQPDGAAFGKAEGAVKELDRAIEGESELATTSAAYVTEQKKKVTDYTAKIAARRIEVLVNDHRAKLVAALAALAEKQKALTAGPSEETIGATESAVSELENVVNSGKEAAEKAPKYAAEIAAAKAKIDPARADIGKRKTEAAVVAQKTEIEAAFVALNEKLAKPDAIAFEAAEKQAVEIESSLEEGAELGAKDPKHAAYIAGLKKKLADQRAAIVRGRLGLKVTAHRAGVEAMRTKVTDTINAIEGTLEPEAFDAADRTISNLMSTLSSGEELAGEDPKYAAELKAKVAEIPGLQMQVRTKRIAAAQGALLENMKAVDTKDGMKAAQNAIDRLNDAVASAKTLKTTNPAFLATVANAEKQIVVQRGLIDKRTVAIEVESHKKRIEESTAQVTAKIEGLGKLEYEPYKAAEEAVTALEKVIAAGQPITERDPAYAKALAAETAKIEGHRIAIRNKWIAAAQAAVAEKIKALDTLAGTKAGDKETDRSFKAAEDAVVVLSRTIESGKNLTKAPAYQKALATAEADATKQRATIDAKRISVVVDAHKVGLEAAEKSVTEKLAAITGKPEDGAFKAAESAVNELSSSLESGANAASKDPAYAKRIAAIQAKIPGFKAQIEKRSTETLVASHKEKLVAARAAVNEKLAAIAKSTDAFAPAEQAIGELSSVIASGKSAGEKSPAYAGELAAEEKKIAEYNGRIAKRKAEVELADAIRELDEAVAAANTAVKAISPAAATAGIGPAPEAAALTAADEAVKALEAQIEDGAELAKGPLGAKLAVAKADVPRKRAAIALARVSIDVAAHDKTLAAASAEAATRVEQLATGGISPASLKAAEGAVSSLESAVKAGDELAKQSPTHAKVLATYPKKIADLRAAIAKRAVETEVKSHREKVAASVADVGTKIGALGKLEYDAFKNAEDSVVALEKVISGGEEISERDASYKKELAATTAKIEGYRITIRQKWIDAAKIAVTEKIAGLDLGPGPKAGDTGREKAFKAADDAVVVLTRTIESGKNLTKAPAYQKFLSIAEADAAKQRTLIDQKRVSIVVDAHKVGLDAAEKSVTEKLSQLAGKPEPDAFKSAESAVNELSSQLESGTNAASKDPAYAKRIAALQSKIAGFKAQIEKREVEVAVGSHKEKLVLARAAVNEKLAAIAKSADAFGPAQQAIGELSSVIASGKSASEKSPAYAKELEAEEKKIAEYNGRIAKRKAEVELADAGRELGEAIAAANAAVKAISPAAATAGIGPAPEAATLTAADEAVKALEDQIEDGAEMAKGPLGAKLAAAKAEVPRKRAAIALARVSIEVAAHDKALLAATTEAATRVEQLATGGISPSSLKAAEGAVSSLESAVKDGDELAKKSPAHAKVLATYTKKIADLRAGIAKRAVETELKAHREKVAAATDDVGTKIGALGKLEYDAFKNAEDSVVGLEKVLSGGEDLTERDASYKKELAAATAKIEGYRITIRQKWIEAAKIAVTEKIAALDAKSTDRAFKAADDAVVVLGRTIDSGKTLTKAPAYQKYLAIAEADSNKQRTLIDQRRVSIVVDAHKVGLDAAEKSLTEKLAALSGKPEPDAFKSAESAVSELSSQLESGTNAAAKDPAYAKRIAMLQSKIAGFKAQIEKRQVDVVVASHKEKLVVARAALNDKLAAIIKSADAFGPAEQAIGELSSVIASGKSAAEESPAYAKELAAEEGKIAGYNARVAKRKSEVELGEAARELGEAVVEANAAVKGLGAGAEPAALTAADEAVSALEEAIGDAGALAKGAFAGKLAAAKAELPKKRAAIASARVGIEVAAHKKALDAATAEAATRVEQLANGISPSSIKAAEGAVSSLESAVKDGSELAKKSPAHAKVLATYSKRVADLRGAIGRRAVETELKAHRAKIEEAAEDVGTKLGALGKLEYEAYKAAEESVASMEKTIASGEDLTERDPSYKKELAAQTAKIEGYRITIRNKWIQAASGAVQEKLAAIEAKPDDRTFKGAEDAVVVLNRTIESGKNLTKAAAYQKQLAAYERQAAAFRDTIDKRRVSIVVDAHKVDLDAAEKTVGEKMKALAGKPEMGVFKEAESAVSALQDTIDSGADAGTKDPAYKKRLAALRGKIDGYKATITKRQFDVEVSGNREKIAAASKAVNAALGSLGKDTFTAAEQAIGELDSALDEGKSFAKENKAYEKELAAEQKKIPGFQARLAKKKVEAQVAEQAEEIAAAQSAVSTAIKGLAGATDPKVFEGAEEAIGDLEEKITEGQKLAKASPAHAKKLAAIKSGLPKQRAAIAGARLNIELAAHKKVVTAANAEAEERVEGLANGITPASFKAAEGAVDGLAEALKSDVAKKSPAHAKWLATYAKKVPALKASIGRKEVETELKGHRAEIAEALSDLDEKMGALDGKLDYDLYAAAETSVNKLEKVIGSGEGLAERDDRYAKELKAQTAKIEGHRITIRKRWIDAANAAAVEKLAALDATPNDKAFKAAEDAVKVFGKTVESGLTLTKAAAYQKMLAANEKKADAYRARIDKRRSQAEFGEVRAELDAAAADAAEKMAEKDTDAASAALDKLADAIDSNSSAADRDPAHKKKVAALKKKLASDRAKLAKLSAAGKGKAELAGMTEASAELSSAMAALTKSPSTDNIDAVDKAISSVESAISEKAVSPKAKAQAAALKKKIVVARGAMNRAKGESTVKEHKMQLAAQLVTAKEAMGGLKKMGDREALGAAENAVDALEELVASGKDLAKANKKYGTFLAQAKKTALQYQTAITKQKKTVSSEEPVAAARHVDEEESSPAEDPKAKLESAQSTARKLMKALVKGANEDTLSSAKVALEDLADTIDGSAAAAKKSKPFAKKVALARLQLSKGKKTLAKAEAVAAKAAAKAAKSAPVAESSSSSDSGEDPKIQVAEAYAKLAKQLKAFKGKKPTSEQIDEALSAAAEMETALDDGAATAAGKTAKYKKYAVIMTKKLKIARAKLTKQRRAMDGAAVSRRKS